MKNTEIAAHKCSKDSSFSVTVQHILTTKFPCHFVVLGVYEMFYSKYCSDDPWTARYLPLILSVT